MEVPSSQASLLFLYPYTLLLRIGALSWPCAWLLRLNLMLGLHACGGATAIEASVAVGYGKDASCGYLACKIAGS